MHAPPQKRGAGRSAAEAALPARTPQLRGGGHPPETAMPRALGNRVHGALLQAKLTVGAPDDRHEREADRVAERVMRMPEAGAPPPAPAPTDRLQRKCAECEEEEQLRRKPLAGEVTPVASRGPAALPAGPAAAISGLRGGGEPLPAPERSFFEQRFGADFGDVRVHTGSRAAAAARSVRARAYTLGRDVVFGAGEYAPGTTGGRRLMAHELTHVLQQGGGGSGGGLIQRAGAGNCALPTETVDEQRDELARAGRIAHSQIQGYFSPWLDSEVSIPRATKAQRSTSCPPSGTPLGRADLWSHGGGLDDVNVGEIKSVNGARYAAPDVDHYLGRLRELAGRFTTGSPCPGPADEADRGFDEDWLGGTLAGGRVPDFEPLDHTVPETPTPLGPFLGDPLYKDLKCERRAGGAVVYWCTLRRLNEEERERERVRLGIPAGERVRRTAPGQGTRAPRVIRVHPGFREIEEQLPSEVPGERIYVVAVPNPLYEQVDGTMRMQQTLRRMQIDVRGNPVFQFRTLTWGTLAVSLAAGTLAAITVAVGVAVAVPAGAAVGAGAAGGGTAAGGGAVVIPLFQAAAAEEVAKAAAVLIVAGTLATGASEAHAQEAVERGMSNPRVAATIDITDDPFALSGGYRIGSHLTVDGLPYRVAAVFHSR